MMSSFYTVKNVAEELNLAIPTIYAWINQGKFDGCVYKFGKTYRFKKSKLTKWINGGEQKWQSLKITEYTSEILPLRVEDIDQDLMQKLNGKLIQNV